MSQPILPTGATRHTAERAYRRRDLQRLLTSWWALSARLIAVQAHGGIGGAEELSDAVHAIEAVLDARHPLLWEAIRTDRLLAPLNAEHIGDRTTSSSECLVCRRLTAGLPDDVRQLIGLETAR